MNSDNHKDACNYSIGMAKMISLVSTLGLVALFLVVSFPGYSIPNEQYILVFLLLITSMFSSFLYIGNICGQVHTENNYSIYSRSPRLLGIIMILSLLFGFLLLGGSVNKAFNKSPIVSEVEK